MLRTHFALTLAVLALPLSAPKPVLAQDHTPPDHAMMDHDDHDHQDGMHVKAVRHDKSGTMPDTKEAMAPGLSRSPAIMAALAAGGEPVVIDVLGVVCDFCAKAMDKTFGKRDEVAAVYVDLDDKTLSLVMTPGKSLDDKTIEKLVKRAGYRTAAIRRGGLALSDTDNTETDNASDAS